MNLAEYIDHTLLRPDAKEDQILALCDEAVQHGFKTVCVEARWLPVVVPRLKGSKVLPITVISFPHGNDSSSKKVSDTVSAVERGAQEVDMVLNRDLLKAKKYNEVREDVVAVVQAAKKVPVKVILETSELTDPEKAIACALCKMAGAAFVKTSTGFSKSGATEADIRLMRDVVGESMGVKASGGVRTQEDALKMIQAGATRVGASSSIAIVQGSSGSGRGY